MYGYIYKTTNKLDGRIYIGKKKGEFNPRYYGSGIELKKDIERLGSDKFTIEVLTEAESLEQLNKLEEQYIYEYSSQDSNVGYNIADGGNSAYSTYGKIAILKEPEPLVIHPKTKEEFKYNFIYFSKNYDMFEYISGNRIVNLSPKLKASIRENGILQPIIVNEKFEIVDGQHRFAAAKETNHPIKFFILYTSELRDEIMVELNISQKRWRREDYIHYYAQKGNANYQELESLIEIYSKKPYKVSATVIETIAAGMYSFSYNSSNNKLEDGEFKLHNKKGRDMFFEYYKRLIDESGNLSFSREFLLPFHKLMAYKQFDIEHFIARCKQDRWNTVKQANNNTDRHEVFMNLLNHYNVGTKKNKELNSDITKLKRGKLTNYFIIPKKEEIDPQILNIS